MDQIKKLELLFKAAVIGVVFSFGMSIYVGIRDRQVEKQAEVQTGTIPAPAF